MSTICADQHKLHPSHLLLSPRQLPFKDLEIPPRKQLLLSKKTHQEASQDMSSFETTSLHKYLPCNDAVMGSKELAGDNDEDDNDLDPYSADQFRMYEFKVRRCNRSRSHDWTDCPFAHPGEKARRRDPRKYQYSGMVCPEFRRGCCGRGDSCEFAHGVFECWLHPSRYRTEACKDGKNCKRKVCFFAHTPRQLRIPADAPCGARKYDKSCLMSSPCRNSLNQGHCCCLVCHSVSSPTSTLLGLSHLSPPLSPSLSPPLSPVKQRSLSGLSPVSGFPERMLLSGSGAVRYKDVLTELMSSLEAMNFNESAVSSPMSGSMTGRNNINSHWIDTCFGDDRQQQFILSTSSTPRSGFASSDPDIGWVNDLLM